MAPREGCDAAQQLLIEDQLQKILHGSGGSRLKKDKGSGFLPRGEESCFGDFPAHLRTQKPGSAASMAACRLLSKSASVPGEWCSSGTPRHGLTGTLEGSASRHTGTRRSASRENSAQRMTRSSVSPRPGSTTRLGNTSARGQRETVKPPVAGARKRRQIESTAFRRFYDRGDLPIHVHHTGIGNRAAWKVKLDALNYTYYLPIFFDGIREKEDPYRFLAIQGCVDLLEHGTAEMIHPCIPQIVLPLKAALNTRDREVMCVALKVMQSLVQSCRGAADALVPYFRQLLPVLNIFRGTNVSTGDEFDYAQRKNLNLGELIDQTLELIEQHATPSAAAYVNIKYMIPTYESCLNAGQDASVSRLE